MDKDVRLTHLHIKTTKKKMCSAWLCIQLYAKLLRQPKYILGFSMF